MNIVSIVCLSIILVLIIACGIWIIYNIQTQKETEYPYYCTQPTRAKENCCGYLGCDGKCLMPYSGCNLQEGG